MSDRFFLVNINDNEPIVELVNVKSTDEFKCLITRLGEDRVLASLSWGIVMDDNIPGDVWSVPLSDMNFMMAKVLMRRLLRYVHPHKFDPHDDFERLRKHLYQVWRSSC